MFNKQRPLDTNIVGIRSCGIEYFLFISSKDQIKDVYFKNEWTYKKLNAKDGKYILRITPMEMVEYPLKSNYNFIIVYENGRKEEVAGQIILKR